MRSAALIVQSSTPSLAEARQPLVTGFAGDIKLPTHLGERLLPPQPGGDEFILLFQSSPLLPRHMPSFRDLLRRMSPMSPVRSVTHVAGLCRNRAATVRERVSQQLVI